MAALRLSAPHRPNAPQRSERFGSAGVLSGRIARRLPGLCAALLLTLASGTSASAQGRGPTIDLVITPPAPSVMEGEAAVLNVSFTGCFDPATDVDYMVTAEPITAGVGDFSAPTPAMITLGVSSAMEMVTAATIEDMMVEGDETFRLRFTPVQGAMGCVDLPPITTTEATAIVTILNDDVVMPIVSIGDVGVVEGDVGTVSAMFAVTLSEPAPGLVSVDFATSNGTATGGLDFISESGQVSFMPGETMQTVSVNVVGDTEVEPDETFFVDLSMPVGLVIGDGQGQGTILNDDFPPLIVSIGDVGVFEGDAGTVNADFTVTLSEPGQAEITVDFATSNGTATGGVDYVPSSGQVVFMAGETMQTVSVTVIGDTDVEPDETFFVDLSMPIGALIGDGQGQGTILNDDVAPLPTLAIADVTLLEGDSGQTNANFMVGLSAPSVDIVSVSFMTEEGSAIGGIDFAETSGLLTFMPGEVTRTIAVPVFGDTKVEPDENFFVDLSGPDGATIADGQGEGTIQNDDVQPPPVLSIFDASGAEGDEGTSDFLFVVGLSVPAFEPVTVGFASASGTAISGEDFDPATGTLTFAEGQESKVITVRVQGDTDSELDETFFVDLLNPLGATIGDGRGEGTIVNDDDPPAEPSLAIGDASTVEGDAGSTVMTFTVTRFEKGGSAVSVDFATSDGTATAGTDYTATAGTLTFAPGETARTIEVEVSGDTDVEPDETLFVDLSNAMGAVIADGQGEGTIENDDADPGQPGLSIDDVSVAEGDAGTTAFVFTVRRDDDGSGPVTVDFATSDGTATAGPDYAATSGTLSFADGETTKTIEVEVSGDTDVEPDESFFVNLSNPTGATLADAQGQGTIQNDDEDAPPSALSIDDVAGAEGDAGTRAFSFTVRLDPASDETVTTSFATANGTATAGSDYQAVSGTLTFAPGETAKTLTVPVNGDLDIEPNETFFLNLSGASVPLADGQGQGVIGNDDEASPFGIESVGEVEIDASAGETVTLEVQVTATAGTAANKVVGVPVLWAVEGDAELLGGETSVSQAPNGVARKDVRLGEGGGEVMVTARLQRGDEAATFRITVRSELVNLFNDDDPARGVAGTLDDACDGASGELAEFCGYVIEIEDPAEQREVIEALLPDQLPSVDTAALGSMSVQITQLFDRMRFLRGHTAARGGTRTASRLQIMGVDPTQIRHAFVRHRQSEERLATALNRALLLTPEDEEAEPEQAVAMDEISRWGFFASGSIASGERDPTRNETGFDFDTRGVTAGVDYALGQRLSLGAALGFLSTDSEFGRDRGELEVEGFSLSTFATYYRDSFFVDAALSYGSNDYSMTRVVNLPQPFRGQSRFVLSGDPGGDQLAFGLGLGADFTFGATSLTTFLRGSWVDSSIDAYSETGDGPVTLAISEQDLESLLGELGVELYYAKSLSWGVLQPQLRVAVLREFEDDSRVIRARFALDRDLNEFVIPTDRPDRSYFNVGLGATATFAHGRSFYVFYDRDLSREDLDRATFSLGLRLEIP